MTDVTVAAGGRALYVVSGVVDGDSVDVRVSTAASAASGARVRLYTLTEPSGAYRRVCRNNVATCNTVGPSQPCTATITCVLERAYVEIDNPTDTAIVLASVSANVTSERAVPFPGSALLQPATSASFIVHRTGVESMRVSVTLSEPSTSVTMATIRGCTSRVGTTQCRGPTTCSQVLTEEDDVLPGTYRVRVTNTGSRAVTIAAAISYGRAETCVPQADVKGALRVAQTRASLPATPVCIDSVPGGFLQLGNQDPEQHDADAAAAIDLLSPVLAGGVCDESAKRLSCAAEFASCEYSGVQVQTCREDCEDMVNSCSLGKRRCVNTICANLDVS